MKIKGIIFDIGGVLLDDPQFSTFWQGKEESKKLRDQFGTGKISIPDFITQGRTMLGLTETNFTTQYNSAYSGMNKIEEVCMIFNQITIDKFIFSDTNPIHFNYCIEKYSDIFNQATKMFLSYEIGLRKDDKESYDYLLKNITHKPEELLFIDNKSEYIEKAASFGINGIVYKPGINLIFEINKFDTELLK
jgi:putative hydrolase of the HAD superfamily